MQAIVAQLPDRVLRTRLDRIGDGDDAGGAAIDRHIDRGRTALALCPRLRFQHPDVDARLLHDHSVADHNPAAIDSAKRALADRRIEILHVAKLDAFVLRGVQDRERQWMLAGPLNAGS